MKTPCVKICRLDPVTFVCVGCKRTQEEIRMWTTYSDEERDSIMKRIENDV